MTGYQAKSHPVLPLDDGTLVPFKELVPCYYIVEWGERVGLPDQTCVPDLPGTKNGSLGNAIANCQLTKEYYL